MFECSTFFCSEAANYIQFVSAGLETIGLTLVYLEIRHPSFARRLEHAIISRSERSKLQGKDLWQRTKDFINLLFPAGILITLYFFFVLYVPEYAETLNDEGKKFFLNKVPGAYIIVGILTLVVLVQLFFLVRRYIANIVYVMSNWANGRALGAFGFCLALLGLAGEIYQITTIVMEA